MEKETKRKKKLNKKEQMIIKAYKEYFPSLKKVCEITNTKLSTIIEMMNENHIFKNEMEAVRVGIFSLAENTLVKILEDDEASTHHKISTARTILQYKQELKHF